MKKLVLLLLPSSVFAQDKPPAVQAQASSVITTKTIDTLVATACDVCPLTYQWTKITGPGPQSIIGATSSIAIVSNLQAGFYIYQVNAKNTAGLIGTDTVGFTVQNCDTTIKVSHKTLVLAARTVYDSSYFISSIDSIIHRTCTPPIIVPSYTSIFTTQTLPTKVGNDGAGGIAVGLKFTTSALGKIVAIRFYKYTGNNGPHTVELYSGSTKVGSAVSTNEPANGWITVAFTSPVAISPGLSYTASVWNAGGYYTSTNNGFSKLITNTPLTGTLGVYVYTNAPKLPTNSYQASNYWVDVVYTK